MSSQAAFAKGGKKPHPGENKLNLTPAIRFFINPDEDSLAALEEKKENMVTIKVRVNADEADSRLNQADLKFPKISTFVKNGPEVAEVRLKLDQEIFHPQGLKSPKDVDKRLSMLKRICVDEARTTLIAEMNFARLEFIKTFTTEGSALREKLLHAKDNEFFDWLRQDVEDVQATKLSRYKKHTESMKTRVAFDSARRTAQFAALQDEIAVLFDSSSDDSSSTEEETAAEKQARVKRQEKAQAAKKVKRKKARELAQDIEADRVCHIAEEEAFKAEVADATVDNGLPKVGTLVCISFENRIWFNLGMLLWVNHRDCFEEQLRYLQNDLAKPRKMSVLESVKRVEILFKYMPFLPPPSSKNMTYDQADWKKRNMSIDKATIRRCQFHALPESYQQRLLDDPEDWKAMTEVVWLDRLLRAEDYDKQIIASKERISKKAEKASSSTSRADDTANTKRHKKNQKPKSANEKTSQGKARYCSMCKKAGMPEGKWKSHHTNDCTNQGDYEQKLSGNAKSNSDAKAQYKREIRKLQKATKSATDKLKKYAKAAKSVKSSKELRKFQKSLSKGKKKKSKSSSDDDSDESGEISEPSSSSDDNGSSSDNSY
jgi:hypothetical protein